MMGFIVGLLDELSDSCAPQLLWDIGCHVIFLGLTIVMLMGTMD